MYAFDGTSLDYTFSITHIRDSDYTFSITIYIIHVFGLHAFGFHSVALGLQPCSDLCSRRFGLHTVLHETQLHSVYIVCNGHVVPCSCYMLNYTTHKV